MAIYHLHVGFVSRSTGRTSVQSAAYICGEKLREDYRDQDADYKNRSHDVHCYKMLVPENSKYRDLSIWNAIENYENRHAESFYRKEEAKNNYLSSARTARTVVVALPKELSDESSIELVEKFAKECFVDRGLAVTYAIHKTDGNPHAHLQVSLRAIGEDGEFSKYKDRVICTKSFLYNTRDLWADLTNEFLEREGIEERVTAKSYVDSGVELEATIHRGWYADQLDFDGVINQENLAIKMRNEEKILFNPGIVTDLLNEKKAVFTQKDILRKVGERVCDVRNISVIFEKVLEGAIYVGKNVKGEYLYTGEKYQQLESDVLSKFHVLSSQRAKTVCSDEVVSSVINKYDFLSEEQKNAVIGLTGIGNVGVLLGKAGAGKTTAMQAVSDIYKNSGSRVIGMSLSAVASENLGKDAGIESETISSWVHRWKLYDAAKENFLAFNSVVTDGVLKQLDWYNDLQRYEGSQLKFGDVIIVDEAGMVGTKEWNEILSAADKFGAKVIAAGDDNQFKAISAGDCFRHFIDTCRSGQHEEKKLDQNVTFCELSEIRRQKEDWQREASVEFSKLNAGDALVRYEHHDRVHSSDNAHNEIARKYLAIEKSGTGAVLCFTRADCALINEEVRSLKRDRGELGAGVFFIDAQSNDQPVRKEFCVNDKIMFLQNDRRLDVKNGQEGVIQSFNDGILSVITESGVRLINTAEYDKIDHAYAVTLHKSQGKTYDNTLVLAHKGMDAKAIYVGMTRHRNNVDFYYNEKDFESFRSLVKSVSKYSHKDLLFDYRKGVHADSRREQVLEYHHLRSDMVSLIEDSRNGEDAGKEFSDLKERKSVLEKELLSNYDACKVYLDQISLTKESLEILCGVRPRPMSRDELGARDRVMAYAHAAKQSRELYEKIIIGTDLSEDPDAFTKHEDYGKFMDAKKRRNGYAREINRKYSLHKEFVVDAAEKIFFICRHTIAQHAAPPEKDRKTDPEVQARITVSLYADAVIKSQEMHENICSTGDNKNIEEHKDYPKYQALLTKRDVYGKKIAGDILLHEAALEKHEPQGITRESIEKQYEKYVVIIPPEVRLAAESVVEEYAKANSEVKDLYARIKAESGFRIKDNKDYDKYCSIRDSRNNYAEKILQYPSIHRDFIRNINKKEKSRTGDTGNFISFKTMESQLNYGRSLKLHVLSDIELEAKNTVSLYAKASNETRSLYEQIKKYSKNVTKSMDYGRYCNLRDHRNELAEQILSNRPLYRAFVNELSRESFISFKNMEKQIDYGRSLKAEQRGFEVDPEMSADVAMYAYWSGKTQAAYAAISKDIGAGSDITKHADYGKYQEPAEKRDEFGREIASNIDSYDKAILKHASDGVSRKEIEERYGHRTDALMEVQAANRELLSEIVSSFDMNRHFAADRYKISKEDLELQRKTEVSMYLSGDTKLITPVRIAEIEKELGEIGEMGETRAGETARIQEKEQSLSQAEVSQAPTHAGSTNADLAEYSRRMLEQLKAEREGMGGEKFLNPARIEEIKRELGEEAILKKTSLKMAQNLEKSVVSKSSHFLQKISEMNISKQGNGFNIGIIDNKDFIKSEQNEPLYNVIVESHRKEEGYGLYVTNNMLNHYIISTGIKTEAERRINEYASMQVQKVIDEKNLKEVSPDLIESCLKQALCFEALKNASGRKELTPESINALHARAQILSEKLGDDNIRLLNNKSLMKEANSTIAVNSPVQIDAAKSISSKQTEQIITSNAQAIEDKQQELSDTLSTGKDKSRGLEI